MKNISKMKQFIKRIPEVMFICIVLVMIVSGSFAVAQDQTCEHLWEASWLDRNTDSIEYVIFCVYAGQLYLCEGGDCETRTLCWYVHLGTIAFLHYQQLGRGIFNGILFPTIGLGFGTYKSLFSRTPIFFSGP